MGRSWSESFGEAPASKCLARFACISGNVNNVHPRVAGAPASSPRLSPRELITDSITVAEGIDQKHRQLMQNIKERKRCSGLSGSLRRKKQSAKTDHTEALLWGRTAGPWHGPVASSRGRVGTGLHGNVY